MSRRSRIRIPKGVYQLTSLILFYPSILGELWTIGGFRLCTAAEVVLRWSCNRTEIVMLSIDSSSNTKHMIPLLT